MTLKMHYDSPAEESVAWEKYQAYRAAETKLWKELEEYFHEIEKLSVKESWAQATALIAGDSKMSEAENFEAMINLLVSRGDFTFMRDLVDVGHFTVRINYRAFVCRNLRWGVAKAVLWSEHVTKLNAKLKELRNE